MEAFQFLLRASFDACLLFVFIFLYRRLINFESPAKRRYLSKRQKMIGNLHYKIDESKIKVSDEKGWFIEDNNAGLEARFFIIGNELYVLSGQKFFHSDLIISKDAFELQNRMKRIDEGLNIIFKNLPNKFVNKTLFISLEKSIKTLVQTGNLDDTFRQ